MVVFMSSVLRVAYINPVRGKFVQGYIKVYLQFISFLHIDMHL